MGMFILHPTAGCLVPRLRLRADLRLGLLFPVCLQDLDGRFKSLRLVGSAPPGVRLVDPLHRIVAPRLWAGFISMPILGVIFNTVGVFGAYLVGVKWLGIYEGSFWANMQHSVEFGDDVLNGVIKSVVFGVVCIWISVFQGYDCVPTSEGISDATTKTVVYSSLAVLGVDFILTAVMFGGLG